MRGPGNNGDTSGRIAGGDGLAGLIENVGGVQAEDRNLVATGAGVGNDREIIDFVDGDASRSSGGAVRRGGGHVARSQGNFFDNGEIHHVGMIQARGRGGDDIQRVVAGGRENRGRGGGAGGGRGGRNTSSLAPLRRTCRPHRVTILIHSRP